MKPRGCSSVGVLPMGARVPVSGSTVNADSVFDARTEA